MILLVPILLATGPTASPAAATMLNQGGPDSFGYTYIDNINEPTGPVYDTEWTDISTTGTALPILAEDAWTVIPIPILVRMYGQFWGTPPAGSGIPVVGENAEISANGFVALTSPGQADPGAGLYINQNLPSNDNRIAPGGFLAVLWDDWQARGANDTAQWEVIGTEPNRRFVVQWTNWSRGVADPTQDMTFQVQITESVDGRRSDIFMIYQGVTTAQEGGDSATIGIQGPVGGAPVALLYSLNTANSTTPDTSTTPPTPRVIWFPGPVFIDVSSVTQAGTEPESALQAGDPSAPDGWTDGEITFTATNVTTSRDGENYVRLRVRVKEINAIDWTYLASAWSPQGDLSISHSLAGGSYDWQYRIEDVNGVSLPDFPADDPNGWLNAFGNTGSPDFRVPQGGAPPKEPPPPPASNGGGEDGGGGGGGGCGVRVPPLDHLQSTLGLAAAFLLLALAGRRPGTMNR